MRSTAIARYAVKLNLSQLIEASSNSGNKSSDKLVSYSAAALAAAGIAISSVSLKQMVLTSSPKVEWRKH